MSDRYSGQDQTQSKKENNPLKKKEKSAELKEFENAKEDFMDSVFKNMEKEYTDLGNPENADFSRGGGKAKMLMNDMRKKFFE